MTMTDSRDAMLATLEDERAQWRALVAEVGEERMTEPGPMGDWSFKDLVAHLLGWRERTIRRLEAAAAGLPEPPPSWPSGLDEDDDVDAINAWFQQQSLDRGVGELLDAADRSYERYAAAISRLPEDQVTSRDAFRWLEGASLADTDLFEHLHDDHEPSIREWLARRG